MSEPCTMRDQIEHSFLRKRRNPNSVQLSKPDVSILLEKIRNNHLSTVVLKIKDHLNADINSVVLEEIISSLYDNKVCQALYLQNLNNAMHDEQLQKLTALLRKKKIWCINLGENYNISTHGWTSFCSLLPKTFITHMYVSEHTISSKLKVTMRDHIRENRKKHKLHSSVRNLKVISLCTNCWWNPINTFRHKMEAKLAEEELKLDEIKASKQNKRLKPSEIEWTETMTGYWAEGVGKGGDKPWKFSCKCGEKCSSYENFRYHPTGSFQLCLQFFNFKRSKVI